MVQTILKTDEMDFTDLLDALQEPLKALSEQQGKTERARSEVQSLERQLKPVLEREARIK